jgi:putative tricarboxylic transport membrane protein
MSGLIMLGQQFLALMDPWVLLVLFGATALGVIIGALPGLSATMGIALLTGLTYKFPVVYTFAILMGVYVGAIYGGSISAILLNIPGTGSAAATALEGHPLAMQGHAESAIKVTRAASIIGTFIGVLALAMIAPPLTKVALLFKSPEYFMLAVFGVLICGSIVSNDIPLKGWLGGLIGLFIAMIGMDKLQGASRFDFGNTDLMGGISLVPAMIGFYGIPEVVKAFSRKKSDDELADIEANRKEKVHEWKTVSQHLRLIIQCALVGIGIGSLPGVGEDVAAWVAYDSAKKTSKHPEKFGHGSYEGVIAPEVANNAAIGGAMIPMLTLAVPGSPPAAVLLGALMIHNIRPGPMIMRDNPTFIYYISALIFLGIVMLWITGSILAKPMSSILKVPSKYLMPIVAVLCMVGSYAINNKAFDIQVAMIFGIFGYFLDKMHFSAPPLILGIILGSMIDENLRRSLMVSSGNPLIFINPVEHYISLAFFIVIIFTIVRTIMKNKKAKVQAKKSNI